MVPSFLYTSQHTLSLFSRALLTAGLEEKTALTRYLQRDHGLRLQLLVHLLRHLRRRVPLPLVVQDALRYRRLPRLALARERLLLEHNAEVLSNEVRREHRRQLGVGVVWRRNLDDVGTDDVEGREAAKDALDLPRRPSSRFGGSSGRRHRGVDGVDVEGEVGRCRPDALLDGCNNALRSNLLNVVGREDRESDVDIVEEVVEAGKPCSRGEA